MKHACIRTLTSHSLILVAKHHFLNPFQTPTIMMMTLSSALTQPGPNPNILSLPVTNTHFAKHINFILPLPFLCSGRAPVCSVPVPEQLSGAREKCTALLNSLPVNLWPQVLKGYSVLPRVLFYISGIFPFSTPQWLFYTFFPIKSSVHTAPPTPLPQTRVFSSFPCQRYLSNPPLSLPTPSHGLWIHPLSCSQGLCSYSSPSSSTPFLPASKQSIICPIKETKTKHLIWPRNTFQIALSLLFSKAKHFESSDYN